MDIKGIEKTYHEVVMGVDEPEFIHLPAGIAREHFGMDIPANIPYNKWIVIGPGGEWELL